MIKGKLALVCGFVLAAIMPINVFAQYSNTINVFSPYTIYGIGELQSQGTLQSRSMAGAGVAVRSRSAINLLNPASSSSQIQGSVLFNFDVEGSSYLLTQNGTSGRTYNTYTSFNIHNLAFQFPITKGVGMTLSVSPYSSVGYYNFDYMITADSYIALYNQGYGDITEGRFGIGWEIKPGLSIGVAGQYYWGTLTREFSAEFKNFTSGGSVNSMSGYDNIYISSLKAQLGVQWEAYKLKDERLIFGATYDIGGDLRPEYTRILDNTNSYDDFYAQSDTTYASLIMPRKLSAGASYSNSKILLAVDYSMQDWSENEMIDITQDGLEVTYGVANTLRVGAEYTPRYGDVRNYANRVSYRGGVSYGTSQYYYGGQSLTKFSITAGAGFPINMIGITKIDVGFEYGSVGSLNNVSIEGADIGLVRQNQFKFSLGFTMFGDDYWFRRYRID